MAHAGESDLGQLDASPTLFTVMAALNAAGYDAGINSPDSHPLRAAIRAELAKRNIPSLAAIKEFVAKNKRRNDTQELSQYISFALTAGAPPRFAINIRDVEIPPDASVIKDFSPLLEAFYKEADIDDLWRRSQPAINQYIARYHGPISDAVLQVNSYLRQQTSGFKGRRFQVLIELLAPSNVVQTRSYGNDYTVVVTPSAELRTFDIRHAYLHYLLDPLSTRYKEILDRKKVLAENLQRVRGLDDSFREDFLQLTTECLIKAVEARLDHKPENVQKALLDGFILTPFFAEHLPEYEKQETAMLLYYPDLVKSIDNVVEDARLSKVTFNNSPAARHDASSAPPPEPPPLTGAAKTLRPGGPALHQARSRKGQIPISAGAPGDRSETDSRRGVLRVGPHRDPAKGPWHGREALSEVARITARAAGEGLGAGVSGKTFHGSQGNGFCRQIFSRGSEGGWRVRYGAHCGHPGLANEFETIKEKETEGVPNETNHISRHPVDRCRSLEPGGPAAAG